MQIPVKMDSPIPRWKHAAHSALLPLPLREHGGVLRSFGTAAAAALVEEGVPPLLHLAAYNAQMTSAHNTTLATNIWRQFLYKWLQPCLPSFGHLNTVR